MDGSNSPIVSNVWGASADGTSIFPLTKGQVAVDDSMEPVWSPDGSKIAFTFQAGDPPFTFTSVRLMNADGTGVTSVGSGVSVGHWSADGGRVSVGLVPEGAGSLSPVSWGIVHTNGSGSVKFGAWMPIQTNLALLDVSGGFVPGGPVWSSNGSKVFYVDSLTNPGGGLGIPGSSNIWVVNSDGTTPKALTSITAINAHSIQPVLSPDGSKIAFASARALDGSDAANSFFTYNIWIVNADGTAATPLTKLTATGASSINPVWSPDGSKLAFVSARAFDGSNASNLNATMNLWIMNAGGTGAAPLTKLTAAGVFMLDPAWSPDGSKLAFDSNRGLDGSDSGNRATNIWVIHVDGSGAAAITKLSAPGADSVRPQWHP